MPVRIYDLGKKLGIDVRLILAKAKSLGMTAAKVPSSSLDKITAEFLEEELLKDYPQVLPPTPTESIAPAPPPAPIAIIIEAPPSKLVRISEIAEKVGLPTHQVQAIAVEFGIYQEQAANSLSEDSAEKLSRLIRSGVVAEKRLKDVEKGSKSLDLQCLSFNEEWIDRIRHCKNIEEINLSNVGLSVLPDAFADLTNLSRIDLSGNSLRQLPKWLLNLPRLRSLYLHGNAALGLPPEILGPTSTERNPTKAQDILEYYFRLQSGGKRPLNEAKLILLGRGEVGKTCLVNRLVHDRFTDTAMTCGISITQWKLDVGKEQIRLHVWDFGGQEIQHATHQFFLTERSLYLIVLNGRAGAEEDDAEYWLRLVKTYGGGSPTIIVLNKFRVQPFELDEVGLKEKYPFIQGFVETDCEPDQDAGIGHLRQQVQMALTMMDHVRVNFPAEWFQIKEKLSEMKDAFISFEEYRNLCASKNERDAEAQETLAVFLNALGIALNFRQDARLRDETVLNPHWITKGVYRIITSQLLSKSKGELRLDTLGSILSENEYPQHMHLFLIELMRKFELCFPYHDDQASHRYLVPELLGKKQPFFDDSFQPKACLNFRYDYRILPEGLLPRFITRTHTMSRPLERWRAGVILRWETCRALVRADRQERQVIIHVFGDQEKRRRLLAVIRENFDQIHIELKEFRPTEWVALDANPNEWVNQRDLEVFHKQNVQEVPKAVGNEIFSVNVAKVLSDSDVAGARSLAPAQDKMQSRPVKTFISYAHADEKWRAKIAPNLNLLEREGLLEIWCDLEIKAGQRWNEEIKRNLEEAELYIVLVSAALLASEYVHDVELPIALKRAQENKARLVPIVIRDCGWKRYLGDVQALPTGGHPIKRWRDRDEAFFDVEEGLRKTIAEIHKLRAVA